MKDPQYLTYAEVAEELRCDKSTIKRYVRKGRLKVIRISSQNVRIDREEFRRFMKAGWRP